MIAARSSVDGIAVKDGWIWIRDPARGYTQFTGLKSETNKHVKGATGLWTAEKVSTLTKEAMHYESQNT
jgi:hypothetical protein